MVVGMLNPDRSVEIKALKFSVTATDGTWLIDDYDNGIEPEMWEVPKDGSVPASVCAIQDDTAVVGFNVGAATDGGEVKLINIRTNEETASFKGVSCASGTGLVDGKVFLHRNMTEFAEFATLDIESGELTPYELPDVPSLNMVRGIGIKRGTIIATIGFTGGSYVAAIKDNKVLWKESIGNSSRCLMVKKYAACTTEWSAMAFDTDNGIAVLNVNVPDPINNVLWASDGFYQYPDGPGQRFDGKPVHLEGKASRLAFPDDFDGATVPLNELGQGFSEGYSFVLDGDGKVVAHSNDGEWTLTQTGAALGKGMTSSVPIAVTASGNTFVYQPTGADAVLWSATQGTLAELDGVTEMDTSVLDGYLVIDESVEHGTRVAIPLAK